jgi:hypothetical protein
MRCPLNTCCDVHLEMKARSANRKSPLLTSKCELKKTFNIKLNNLFYIHLLYDGGVAQIFAKIPVKALSI